MDQHHQKVLGTNIEKNMADNLEEYAKFVCDHKTQLLNAGIPDIYWKALHKKLSDEVNNILFCAEF